MNRMNRRLNHHIVKPEPAQPRPTRPHLNFPLPLQLPTERRVEVLYNPKRPIIGRIAGKAENLGGALALAADTERASIGLVVVIIRVIGFEIGGAAGAGGRDDNPPVVYGVFS